MIDLQVVGLCSHRAQVGFDLGWFYRDVFVAVASAVPFSLFPVRSSTDKTLMIPHKCFQCCLHWIEIHSRKGLGVWKQTAKSVTQKDEDFALWRPELPAELGDVAVLNTNPRKLL